MSQKLKRDIEKALNTWNERSSFKLKGIGNLSRADLDSILLYAEIYERTGGRSLDGFMKPCGAVEKVLDAYNMSFEDSYGW